MRPSTPYKCHYWVNQKGKLGIWRKLNLNSFHEQVRVDTFISINLIALDQQCIKMKRMQYSQKKMRQTMQTFPLQHYFAVCKLYPSIDPCCVQVAGQGLSQYLKALDAFSCFPQAAPSSSQLWSGPLVVFNLPLDVENFHHKCL